MENNEFELNTAEIELLQEDTILQEPIQPQDEVSSHQETKHKSKQSTGEKTILAYLHDLVYLLAGIMLVLLLLFRVVVVSGPSMNNTLLDGDYLLLLNNVLYREIQPGDIVVASKDSFQNGEPIIKRVIATEGDKVNIDFETGIVYVNDIPLDEPYTLTPTNMQEGIEFPLVVEEGCLFVMGDNRNSSKDSRNPEIGQIDTREVLGKAVLLMIPGADELTGERDYGRIGVFE